MLLVNDFTHHGAVGDCQHANNIYSLTPLREAADFSLLLLSAAVSPPLNNQTCTKPRKRTITLCQL